MAQKSAQVTGTAASETATLGPGALILSGGAVTVNVSNTEAIEALDFHKRDTATLTGSASIDGYTGTPTYGRLAGEGGAYLNIVRGFRSVVAEGGLSDLAWLADSSGSDTFIGSPTEVSLVGWGVVFEHHLRGFGQVKAFFGERFEASPNQARMVNKRSDNNAVGFREIFASAANGGPDTAILQGSVHDDALLVMADYQEARLYSSPGAAPFYISVKYFDQVFVDALTGATDAALFRDAPVPETLTAGVGKVQLRDAALTYLYEATGFDTVGCRSDFRDDGDRRIVSSDPLGYDLVWGGHWET